MTITATSSLVASDWGWRHTGRRAWALRGIDLRIEPGERVLVLGASGSGKSTLLAGLAGLLDPEEGEHEGNLGFDDSTSLRGTVALVQQDPESQIVMARIGDEVAFGCENIGVPSHEIWERVEEAVALVGLDLPLDHPTNELSGGQKQRLALAAALAMRPQVLLLDEPTANLDPEGVALVRDAVERIARTGITLIVIEHRVDAWLPLATRIVALDHGRILADGTPDYVLREHHHNLLEAGVWIPGAPIQFPVLTHHAGKAVVTTTDLQVGYRVPVQSDLNLSFAQGSGTCIVGPNGSGKTSLALTLAGLLSPLAGSVTLGGLAPNSLPAPALAAQVATVFQEPSYQFITGSVRAELEFGADGDARKVDEYLDSLGLTHLDRAHPQSLSGGEKRRLSVATALIREPKVLILDEPTFGQDRNTWIALVELIRQRIRAGTTVIAVTHDSAFIAALGGTVLELPVQKAPSGPRVTPVASPMNAVNPMVQVASLFIMTLPLILTIDVVSAVVALGIELVLLPLIGWGPRRLLHRIWPLLIAAPLSALSMLLYAADGGASYWQWGPINISENSISLAIAIGLRVLAVGIPAVVVLGDLDPTDTADALTQKGHLPARPVLSTLAGIRLVSLMLEDWDALTRARRSRGVEDRSRLRAFPAKALGLFTFALRRAGTLSVTMEARGFGAPVPRSRARHSDFTWADLIMLAVAIAVPAVALSLAVATGTFRWFGI